MSPLMFAVLFGVVAMFAAFTIRYVVPALEARFGLRLTSGHVAAAAVFLAAFAGAGRNFAQSTIDIEIDLSNFWLGFNQFFAALFPPMAFIASISAALGFIFLIVRALKNAFGGAT